MGMKMYCCYKYADVMIALIRKEIDIYEANSKNVSLKRAMLAQRFASLSEWIFNGGCTVYMFGGMFYLLNPLYSYYWLGEIVPILPIYMPLIDETTTEGFIGLTVMHLVFLVLTVVSTAAADFMYVLLIFNMILFARIFSDNVDELNATLRGEEVNRIEAKFRLTNILLIHREIFE